MRRRSGRSDDAAAGLVFAALADDTRRTVVTLLGERGPLTQTELARVLPVSRQAVAKHLVELREAGLVESSRKGRESRFRLTPEPFEAASLWMIGRGAQWDRRLEALQHHVEGTAPQ